MNIVNYYEKLKQLWDELTNYDQPPTCKCEGYTCDLGSIIDKKQEEERVHTFLMWLDDTVYDTIRSNILAHDPLPNLDKVYSILIQEKRVQTMARGKEDRGEVIAFAARGRVDEKDRPMICSHCKRSGYDTNSCFALIGYPCGGVIDCALTERMEVVVGDRDPRYSMGKTKQ